MNTVTEMARILDAAAATMETEEGIDALCELLGTDFQTFETLATYLTNAVIQHLIDTKQPLDRERLISMTIYNMQCGIILTRQLT